MPSSRAVGKREGRSEPKEGTAQVVKAGGATAPTQQVAQALHKALAKSLLSEEELACKEGPKLCECNEVALISLLAMW